MATPPAGAPDGKIRTMRRARQIRIERGLTQAEVASRLGLTVVMLAFFETGRNSLSATRLLDLADILQANPRELLEIVERPAVMPRIRKRPHTGGPNRQKAASVA